MKTTTKFSIFETLDVPTQSAAPPRGHPRATRSSDNGKGFDLRMLNKYILWTLVLIVLVSQVHGFGIAPGEKEIPYKPGEQTTVEVKIINSNHENLKIVFYAEGELADKVTFKDPFLEIKSDQTEAKTSYTFHQPSVSELKKQGEQTINIVARGLSGGNNEGIGANLAVVSALKLMVPYKGKYVRSRLFVANFQNGQPSNFVVEAENLGDEDVVQGQATVDVLGPFNDKILTLTSHVERINAKSRVLFTLPWTPELNVGQYQAMSTVIYDNKNVQDSKSFTLGEQKVAIESIDVRNFKLGGIAKFEVMLQNNWNTPVDGVYGEITIVKDGKIYTQSKTENVGMQPREKKVINGYWDTSTVIPEKYELKLKLYYSGKTEDNTFPITVTENEIHAEGVGRVIGATTNPQDKVMTYVYLLTLLVIILIAINGYLYFRKPRSSVAAPGGVVPKAVVNEPLTPQAATTPVKPAVKPPVTMPPSQPATPHFDEEHHEEIQQHIRELEQIHKHIESTPPSRQPPATSPFDEAHHEEIQQHIQELEQVHEQIQSAPVQTPPPQNKSKWDREN